MAELECALLAGYHALYGRPNWPQDSYDEAWSRFEQDDHIHARGARFYDQVAENRGLIQ